MVLEIRYICKKTNMNRRLSWIWGMAILALAGASCSEEKKVSLKDNGEDYVLAETLEVSGRQGVACDGTHYYVSGSTALYKYDMEGRLLLSNEAPFEGLELPANHIGDIDVHDGDLYAGIETFMDGVGQNIQVAVYDAETLQYKYSIPWTNASGQVEVCGLAVDADHGQVWMADWVQGHELYCYDLASHTYLGKTELSPAPSLQQGILYVDGQILISADDGDAEEGRPDHLYVTTPVLGGVSEVSQYREMDDFLLAGEIEGLTLNPADGSLVVLSNRGARIILGMPRGFYPGYDREIHNLYIYR